MRTTTSGIDSPTIRQRKISTTVVVDDGQSIALGGLVLCGPSAQKRDAAEAAGLSVDIWIDDTPETIPSSGETRAAVKYSTSLGARAAAAAAIARLRNYAG